MKNETNKTSADKNPPSARSNKNTRVNQESQKKLEEKYIYTDNKYEDDADLITHKRKRSGFSFFTKLVLFTSITAAIVFVSLNITPILKYALQDQNSAIYPILKKYADELRIISSRLTSVTRRLNMLSVISKESNLNNISNVNRLVLQINDMWTTTKKYLNLIGIETIAHSNLEKEIDANSKVNKKGVIQDSKVEQIFPEDHFTLTNILNLDSIVQDLNIEIDNIDNEITYMENNVYASIKASNIYSQLLERSRSTTNDYYSNSNDATYPVSTIQAIAVPNKTLLNVEQNDTAIIKTEPIANQNQVSIKNDIEVEVEKTQRVQRIGTVISKTLNPIQPPKTIPKLPIETKIAPSIKPADVKVATIQKPVEKPIEKIVIKDKVIIENRKDQSNSLMQDTTTGSVSSTESEVPFGSTAFDSPSLLDDISLEFNSTVDDYGEIEIKKTEANKSVVEEDDDYTGG